MEPEDIIRKAERMGADEAEVFFLRGVETEISVENNQIDFGGGAASTGYSIRVLKDGRIGFSYFSEENTEKAIESALKLSKLGKRIDGYSFLKDDAFPAVEGVYSDEVANMDPEEALEMTKEMFESALLHEKMVVAGGGLGYGYTEYFIYNSHGVYAEGKESAIGGGVYAVLPDKTVSNGTAFRVSHMKDIDFSEVGKEAGQRAIDTQGAGKLEKPGRMQVLFHPRTFTSLIEYTAVVQLYGNRAHRGESVYRPDMMGNEVAARGLSLYDDQLNPMGMYTAPSDDEGGISRKLALIEGGKLAGFMYDSVSAAEFGAEATGNGMRSGARFKSPRDSTPPETVARNISLEFPEAKDFDALISEMDRGVIVYSVLGAHTANAVTGDISVNSPTLFYVENGEIKHPVASAMIGTSSVELLKGIIAVSRERRPITGDISGMSFIMPYVLVDGINVA
jgi:PmbA protein